MDSAWTIFREAAALTRKHFWLLGWLLSVALLPLEVFFVIFLGGQALSLFAVVMADPTGALDHATELAASAPTWGGWWEVAAIVLSVPLSAGFLGASLRLARGERASWRDVVAPYRRTGEWLFALVFVVPGLCLFPRWGLYPVAMVDEGIGPVAALRRSEELAQGAGAPLFVLLLLVVTANAIGYVLPLGIGLVFTVPLGCLAWALFYEKMRLAPA